MKIGKPYRLILATLLSGAITGLIVGISHRLWLVLIYLPIYLATETIINSIDLWLRRTTKDQLWLWGSEGKQWLETPEGQAWKNRTGYKR